MTFEKLSCIDVEKALIGTVLTYPEQATLFADVFLEEKFYVDLHKKIIRCFKYFVQQKKDFDILTVVEFLKTKNEQVTIEVLRQMLEFASTPESIFSYYESINNKWKLRQCGKLANQILSTINTLVDDSQIDSFFQIIEKQVTELSNVCSEVKATSFRDALAEEIKLIEEHAKQKPVDASISTGIEKLDKVTHGLKPSDLVILAARPAMGKTALALNIAMNVVLQSKKVLFISLEMTVQQLIQRILSAHAKINSKFFRTREFTTVDVEKSYSFYSQLDNTNFFVTDKPSMNIFEISSLARKIKMNQGLDLVVIDYLQIMGSSLNKKNETRDREIGQMTMGLKNLAKELNCTVLSLSQLNRGVEHRQNKQPKVSDLRESGSIEQDADQIFLLHRPEVFEPLESNKNIAELIIGKNRHGDTGKVELFFHKEYSLFKG